MDNDPSTSDLRARFLAYAAANNSNHSALPPVLMLHSYSYSVHRLHFGCWQTADETRDLVEQCRHFYAGRFCLFTCPQDCVYADGGELLWQVSGASYRYVFASVVCQAAQHSRAYPSGVMYVDETEADCRRPLIERRGDDEQQVATTANSWPLSIDVDTERAVSQCFRFRLDPKLLETGPEPVSNNTNEKKR